MINDYLFPLLTKLQCEFTKGNSTRYFSLVLIENCFVVLDKRGCANITLTDFAKAFDCINYELIIVKPHGYSSISNSLKFTRGHLFNRIEDVNSFFSRW